VLDVVDVVVIMGCGDARSMGAGKPLEDWTLDDPAGQLLQSLRPIRDEIRVRVQKLLGYLGVPIE
jgi:hypothetical protein